MDELPPFDPFFKNPHISTLAGNFWSRPDVDQRWPVEAVVYQTEPQVAVLVHSQSPDGPARGEIILVHGLEGSSAAGYARSMSFAALEAGYATHRFNMRSCGGTEHLALSNYHSGQTSDLLYVLRERRKKTGLPIYLVGFSLGGNVVLKLTGELGEQAQGTGCRGMRRLDPYRFESLRDRARQAGKLHLPTTILTAPAPAHPSAPPTGAGDVFAGAA